MKYICAGAKRTEEQTQKSLDAGLKLAQEHPGLGTWIIHPLEKTEPLGLAILRLPAADLNMHGFEIGYSVIPEFWGKGIATEAATRLIQYAFNELKLYRVVAIIDPQHAVSRKILEKLQFSPAAPIRFHDPITGVPLPAEALYLDNPDSTQ
jgi:RimJ/RimL family protein N-acetyltransferase